MTLSTDDIDKLFSEGRMPSAEEITFNQGTEQERNKILEDIKTAGYSLNQFADECYLQHSHLYDFVNGKKNLSRDRILTVFLNLHYSYEEISRMLRRFQLPQLYPRNNRDYLIMLCIQKQLSVDEISQELERNGFTSLCP